MASRSLSLHPFALVFSSELLYLTSVLDKLDKEDSSSLVHRRFDLSNSCLEGLQRVTTDEKTKNSASMEVSTRRLFPGELGVSSDEPIQGVEL